MNNEGELCPKCEEGHFEYIRVDDCFCHISPPCSACVEAPLICDKCGRYADEPTDN